MATTDPYLDPELYDAERPCTACGRHQGECDGPPQRCCEACEHWTPLPAATDDGFDEDDVPAGDLLISVTVDDYLAARAGRQGAA